MFIALLAAIAIDTTACASGTPANCPSVTQAAGTGNSITTASFSTSANVVLAACTTWANSSGSVVTPVTVSGAGLTWTKQVEGAFDRTGNIQESSSCWTASSAGALSSQTVTSAATGSGTKIGVMLVYVFTGASSTPGNSGTKEIGFSFSNVDVTVTATAAGNYMVGGFVDCFSTSGLTAAANSTLDKTITGASCEAGIAHLTSTTSGAGSVTFGASTNQAVIADAGLEIAAGGGAAAAAAPQRTQLGVGQ
jgi:hypothetical protein